MNVVELFAAQARERPDAVALVEGRGRRRRAVSYAELDRRGARAAGALAAAGVRPGERVLVLVPLSIRLYEVVAGVLRLGAAVQLVDPGAGRDAVAGCLERVPPDAWIGSPQAHALRLMWPAVRRLPRPFSSGAWVPGARRLAAGPPRRVEAVGRGHPALLTFTSGSTGAPKAVVRSHGLLRAQHAALARALELRPGETDLATLPVFVLANLASGVTTVLPDADLRAPGAVDVVPLLHQIAREQPTRLTASPAFAGRLAAGADRVHLASFRRVDVGGGPVFPDLLARLDAAMPGARLVAVYGSTEAEPIAHVNAAALSDADRARIRGGGGLPAGRPVPEVELRVVADAWGEPRPALSPAALDAWTLPPGEPGEIVVAGEHVVPGYLGGVGDAETKVRVGGRVWHRTGDAGRLDPDGRLWLLGRCSAAARDGATLYPFQAEAAARALPGVARAALVPGRRVLVFEGDADARELQRALAWASLAVHRVDRIPLDRRHNAKVDERALARLADALPSPPAP